jgi:hypothetical protein
LNSIVGLDCKVELALYAMAPNQILLTQFVKPISREEREAQLEKLSHVISQVQVVEGDNAVTSIKEQLGRPCKLLLPQMTLVSFSKPLPTTSDVP